MQYFMLLFYWNMLNFRSNQNHKIWAFQLVFFCVMVVVTLLKFSFVSLCLLSKRMFLYRLKDLSTSTLAIGQHFNMATYPGSCSLGRWWQSQRALLRRYWSAQTQGSSSSEHWPACSSAPYYACQGSWLVLVSFMPPHAPQAWWCREEEMIFFKARLAI